MSNATESLAKKFAKSKKMRGVTILSKETKEDVEWFDTGFPGLNLAFSGKLDGGTRCGVTTFAGRSKSFKTILGLISAKAYMDYYPDSFMIFYDSEGGASAEYFASVGVDPDRVIKIPVMNIEELTFDMTEKLEEIRKDYDDANPPRFVFFVDSIGNLASIKEATDALKAHGATDMGTRAKSLKSLFRIVTPYFVNYGMHGIFINHVTADISGMGGRDIMTGGSGILYSSNEVFVIGKRQVKEGTNIIGWNFIINIEKSRTVRERAAVPFIVTYEEGIDKYSGLLDIALITGHVVAPTQGWYSRPSIENDKKWRRKDTSTSEFWQPLLEDEGFNKAVTDLYVLDDEKLMASFDQGTIEKMEEMSEPVEE